MNRVYSVYYDMIYFNFTMNYMGLVPFHIFAIAKIKTIRNYQLACL